MYERLGLGVELDLKDNMSRKVNPVIRDLDRLKRSAQTTSRAVGSANEYMDRSFQRGFNRQRMMDFNTAMGSTDRVLGNITQRLDRATESAKRFNNATNSMQAVGNFSRMHREIMRTQRMLGMMGFAMTKTQQTMGDMRAFNMLNYQMKDLNDRIKLTRQGLMEMQNSPDSGKFVKEMAIARNALAGYERELGKVNAAQKLAETHGMRMENMGGRDTLYRTADTHRQTAANRLLGLSLLDVGVASNIAFSSLDKTGKMMVGTGYTTMEARMELTRLGGALTMTGMALTQFLSIPAAIGIAMIGRAFIQAEDAVNKFHARTLMPEEFHKESSYKLNEIKVDTGMTYDQTANGMSNAYLIHKEKGMEAVYNQTERAMHMEKIWGVSAEKSLTDTNKIMKKFGVSSEQAWDMYVAGAMETKKEMGKGFTGMRGIDRIMETIDKAPDKYKKLTGAVGEYNTAYERMVKNAEKGISEHLLEAIGNSLNVIKVALAAVMPPFERFFEMISNGAKKFATFLNEDGNEWAAKLVGSVILVTAAFALLVGPIMLLSGIFITYRNVIQGVTSSISGLVRGGFSVLNPQARMAQKTMGAVTVAFARFPQTILLGAIPALYAMIRMIPNFIMNMLRINPVFTVLSTAMVAYGNNWWGLKDTVNGAVKEMKITWDGLVKAYKASNMPDLFKMLGKYADEFGKGFIEGVGIAITFGINFLQKVLIPIQKFFKWANPYVTQFANAVSKMFGGEGDLKKGMETWKSIGKAVGIVVTAYVGLRSVMKISSVLTSPFRKMNRGIIIVENSIRRLIAKMGLLGKAGAASVGGAVTGAATRAGAITAVSAAGAAGVAGAAGAGALGAGATGRAGAVAAMPIGVAGANSNPSVKPQGRIMGAMNSVKGALGASAIGQSIGSARERISGATTRARNFVMGTHGNNPVVGSPSLRQRATGIATAPVRAVGGLARKALAPLGVGSGIAVSRQMQQSRQQGRLLRDNPETLERMRSSGMGDKGLSSSGSYKGNQVHMAKQSAASRLLFGQKSHTYEAQKNEMGQTTGHVRKNMASTGGILKGKNRTMFGLGRSAPDQIQNTPNIMQRGVTGARAGVRAGASKIGRGAMNVASTAGFNAMRTPLAVQARGIAEKTGGAVARPFKAVGNVVGKGYDAATGSRVAQGLSKAGGHVTRQMSAAGMTNPFAGATAGGSRMGQVGNFAKTGVTGTAKMAGATAMMGARGVGNVARGAGAVAGGAARGVGAVGRGAGAVAKGAGSAIAAPVKGLGKLAGGAMALATNPVALLGALVGYGAFKAFGGEKKDKDGNVTEKGSAKNIAGNMDKTSKKLLNTDGKEATTFWDNFLATATPIIASSGKLIFSAIVAAGTAIPGLLISIGGSLLQLGNFIKDGALAGWEWAKVDGVIMMGEAATAIGEQFGLAWEWVKTNGLDMFVNILTGIGDFLVNAITFLTEGFKIAWEWVFNDGITLLGNIFTWLTTEALPTALEFLSTGFGLAWEWIKGDGIDLLTGFFTWLISDALPMALQGLLTMFLAAWTWVTGDGIKLLGSLFLWLVSVALPNAIGFVMSLFGKAWLWVMDDGLKLFGKLLSWLITEGVPGAVTGVKDLFNKAWEWVKDDGIKLFGKLLTWLIDDFAPSLGTNLMTGIKAGLSGLGDFILGLIPSWSTITNFIKGKGGDGEKKGKGAKKARGGLVNAPTFGVIGEAGPEMIIPLGGNMSGVAHNLFERTASILGYDITGKGQGDPSKEDSSMLGNSMSFSDNQTDAMMSVMGNDFGAYADGGIVGRPHFGLVGEDGPESIIPLSSGRRSRALDLYEQTGAKLGVKPYANGGIVGGAKTSGGNSSIEASVGVGSVQGVDLDGQGKDIGNTFSQSVQSGINNDKISLTPWINSNITKPMDNLVGTSPNFGIGVSKGYTSGQNVTPTNTGNWIDGNVKTPMNNLVNTSPNFGIGVSKGYTTGQNNTPTGTSAFLQAHVAQAFDKIVAMGTPWGAKLISGFISGVNSMASPAVSAVTTVGNTMLSGLAKVLNGLTSGLNSVLSSVGSTSKIASWSPPRYAKGTNSHPGGLAVVGDGGGEELIKYPNGQMELSPSTDTLMNLPKGTEVLPHKQTLKAMGIPAYAKGVGFDGASDIFDFLDDPTGLMENILKKAGNVLPAIGGAFGAMQEGSMEFMKKGFNTHINKQMEESMVGVNTFGSLRRTSPFGMRRHPIFGDMRLHAGMDLAGPMGTPIRANVAGKVSRAGAMGGLGNAVYLQSGMFTHVYAHLQRIIAKAGQSVGVGDLLGLLGSTGNSTGPHLHYEVRKGGTAINPVPFLGNSFANGGLISQHQMAEIGEEGQEMIIPLNRKARGLALWEQAGSMLGAFDGKNSSPTTKPPVRNSNGGKSGGSSEKSSSQDNSVTIQKMDIHFPESMAGIGQIPARKQAQMLMKELQKLLKEERIRQGNRRLTLEDVVLGK